MASWSNRRLAITIVGSLVLACGGTTDTTAGGCKSNADCTAPATCDLAQSPHACVTPSTCVPACAAGQVCDLSVSPPVCKDPPDGVVTLTLPDGTVPIGGSTVNVSANASGPGGATKVEFRIEQGATSSTLTVTQGTNDVFTGQLTLTGHGLTTGAATMYAKVFWMQDTTERNKDSAPVSVTLDESAPAISGPTTDHPFYSTTASGAPANANVSVQVTDVGAAGVDQSQTRLFLGTHNYPATASSGTYTFVVPVADLGASANTQGKVAYVVGSADTLGNQASFDGGSIAYDNNPPSFQNIVADTTNFVGVDGGVSFKIDVDDVANGAGLDAASVKLKVQNGSAVFSPSSTSGPTRTFSLVGGDIQAAGVQGAVSLVVVAQDNVLNQATSTPTAVKVDRLSPVIGAVTATANGASGSNGFYARNAGTPVPVTVVVDDGTGGSGAATSTLALGGNTIYGTGPTGSGTAKTFSFNIDPTLATAGQEGDVVFSVTAADGVGNSSSSTPSSARFKIDDLGPAISNVAVTGGVVISTVPWFSQTGADLDVTATIVDNGSGVSASDVLLVAGTTTLATGTLDGSVANKWHFAIPRVNAKIPAGQQGTIAFTIQAKDTLGHAQQATGSGTLGIDGKAPTASFSIAGQYPSGGCDTSGTITCGHDGNRFWRLGDDGSSLTFTADDGTGGSGIATAAGSGTCTVPGQGTCTATYTSGNTYTFTVNPSQATFSSDANGEGSVVVSVTAKDLVGNVSTAATSTMNITRFKWARSMSTLFNSIKGAPVVTPPISGSQYILVAGTAGTNVDPIAQLGTNGSVVGTAGKNAGSGVAITTNLAYSPTTNLVYAMTAAGVIQSFTVGTGGMSTGTTCDLSGNPTAFAAGMAIVGNTSGTERVLASDGTNHNLYALKVNGGCGQNVLVSVGTGTLGPPATDGSTVYLTYQNRGLAKVSYSGSFGSPTTVDLGTNYSPLGPLVPVSSSAYVALNRNFQYQAFSLDFGTNQWATQSTAAGAMLDTITASPVVHGGLVFGVAGSSDGSLRAFDASAGATGGAQVFAYAATSTISAVAIGKESTPTYYFTTGNGELVAIGKPSGSTASLATGWSAKLKLTSVLGGTNVGFTGVGTEPTIGSDGTLYFAADNGRVYAIMTDAGGTVAPSAANWPRVGFDNCNSGNSSYTNCP